MTKCEQLIKALNQFKGGYLGDGVAPNVKRSEIVAELEAQQAEILSLRLLLDRALSEKEDEHSPLMGIDVIGRMLP